MRRFKNPLLIVLALLIFTFMIAMPLLHQHPVDTPDCVLCVVYNHLSDILVAIIATILLVPFRKSERLVFSETSLPDRFYKGNFSNRAPPNIIPITGKKLNFHINY